LADKIYRETNGHPAPDIDTDQIIASSDGDKLDVTFNPANYIPDATISEADDVDDLAAHLKGIDVTLPDAPKHFVYDFRIESINGYQVTIYSGFCRSDDDTVNIESESNITVDITASGVNGLDTGSEQVSQYYYVWIIYNPTTDTVAGLLSLSNTSPTLPSGYTKKRRIGTVKNNSLSDILKMWTAGSNNCRHFKYREEEFNSVLIGGTSATYADVDFSGFLPPVSQCVTIHFTRSDGFPHVHLRENGITVDHDVVVRLTTWVSFQQDVKTDANQIIEYKMLAGGVNMYCSGFREEI